MYTGTVVRRPMLRQSSRGGIDRVDRPLNPCWGPWAKMPCSVECGAGIRECAAGWRNRRRADSRPTAYVFDKMMEYNQIIAERINRLCEENHMTIAQLADACKMNRATIENIMSGKCRKPRIQTLYKISGVFHMTVHDFLDFPEKDDPPQTAG